MSFQILKIVLYGNSGETRILPFRTDSVNIITGASKTGKSALIDITNYCLGRRTSSIPEGVILENVSWFGLHLSRGQEEMFVARRNPWPAKSSSEDIYVEKGRNLKVPNHNNLIQNANRDTLIRLLTEFAGISEYAFEPKPGQTRKTGVADIGKALIYCFQEQGEIANKRFLFHRQGEQFLPQSIKDYMPFFLGLVNKEHVLLKEKLRRLKQELRKLESKEAEKKRLKGASFERAHALIAEAISVGLLSADQRMPQSWSEVKEVLRAAINTKVELDIPEGQYARELNRLFEAQKQLRHRYRTAGEEVAALRTLKSGGDGFAQEANEQRARLSSIGLLPINEEVDHHICPLCSSALKGSVPDSEAIYKNLKNISKQLEGVTSDLPHIEQMIAMAEARQAEVKSELREINAKIQAIQQANRQIEEIRDSNAKRALIQGRLGLYLETIAEFEDEPAANSDIENLRSSIQSLEELLDIDTLQERLNSTLSVLSQRMTEMARRLELEHSCHPIRLDPNKLTVVADTENGPLPMERMGSAENWVSLHLITYLVLHCWFGKKGLPVPHLVFFDQPTQAYFPPDVADETVRNSDMESVIRMFQFIAEMVKDAGFQVIITEHADIRENWYQEMVTEKWWDGIKKLIPLSWLNG